MISYAKIEVSEQQLEDLVRQHAGDIEAGMVYMDHQHSNTAGGRLDVFLVDSGRALVVAELKVVEDDAMLMQALDYYDYVNDHIEAFARLYKLHKIDPTQSPRILLIAPSFSQTLVNRCKWIDAPISLFSFNCLRIKGVDGVLPVFSEGAIPSPIETVEVHHIDDRVSYITDTEARERITKLMDVMRAWLPGRVVLDPIKYAISAKVDGRVFGYLEPRRKFFLISTYNSGGTWAAYPIHANDDLEPVTPLLKQAMEDRKN